LVDKLYLVTGYRLIYYNYNDKIQKGPKLGIEYHFGEKREKKLNNNIRELFILNKNKSKSKKNINSYLSFSQRFEYLTSFTYLFQYGQYKEFKYKEYTWYNSISINLNKSFYFGLQYLNIFTNGSIIEKQNTKTHYYLFGMKMLYDFLPHYEDKLFIETSINIGNFCTCGDYDPYKKRDLYYFGLSFGYDYPIFKRLALRFGFSNYVILNKIEDKYNYTQYTLGLNFNLGKKYNKKHIKFHELL